MDIEDLEPNDIVAYISVELVERCRNATDASIQVQIIQDFLRRWESDNALEQVKKQRFEFEPDLHWFNVKKPLSMEGLRGKLLILDFFTYCCINCMHIFPDLQALEQQFSIERGLIIVGVHSPKFSNEKDSENIKAAILRYNITHPIVNDTQMALWHALNVKCWPTLMVFDPNGAPMLMLMGEGHNTFLERFVGEAIRFFQQHNELNNFSVPIKLAIEYCPQLRYPANIARSDDGLCFAIADAGNHRILVVNILGLVLYKIGSGFAGLVDGNFRTSRFKSPQGVAFLNNDIIVVADTENHALRQITLSTGLVETLAGTGYQGYDRIGGKIGPLQDISSPWDIAIYRTRDMDMSFHIDEHAIQEKTIVLVSMAGTHQIWGYFPESMIWWKFRRYEPKTCASLLGNGLEENRNNSYPQNAAFAQPSGLAIAKNNLFIADSESSSIRKASMVDGKVQGVVGGDRNPQNLFAFGDVDGKHYNAKLQHPVGVAYNHVNERVYVADTFNHKIKEIDPISNTIKTLHITELDGITPYSFKEPSGLCIDKSGQNLLVCDTNNHSIVRVNFETMKASKMHMIFNGIEKDSNFDSTNPVGDLEILKHMTLNHYKQLKLCVTITLKEPLKFTKDAPQKWTLNTSNSSLKAVQSKGTLENGKLLVQLQRIDLSKMPLSSESLKFQISLNLCDNTCCLIKRFTLVLENDNNVSKCSTMEELDGINDELYHVQMHISPNDFNIY